MSKNETRRLSSCPQGDPRARAGAVLRRPPEGSLFPQEGRFTQQRGRGEGAHGCEAAAPSGRLLHTLPAQLSLCAQGSFLQGLCLPSLHLQNVSALLHRSMALPGDDRVCKSHGGRR